MNAHLGTVGLLPLTSGSHATPFRLPIRFRDVDGLLLGDQLRFVSQRRLLKRVGSLPDDDVRAALQVLRDMFEE